MGYKKSFNLVTIQLIIPLSTMTKAEYKNAYGIDLDDIDIEKVSLLQEEGNKNKYYVDEVKTTENGVDIYAGGKILSIGENVSVSNGYPVTIEYLKDEEGHLRFLEGVISPATISGVTPTYYKWSLSGSHLMIVLAFKIDANTAMSGYFELGRITDLPAWIRDKMIPSGDNERIISIKYADEWQDANTPLTPHFYCGLQKISGGAKIQISAWGVNYTPTSDTFVRIAFDLLIDNE